MAARVGTAVHPLLVPTVKLTGEHSVCQRRHSVLQQAHPGELALW